jgi:hypothetical protein
LILCVALAVEEATERAEDVFVIVKGGENV